MAINTVFVVLRDALLGPYQHGDIILMTFHLRAVAYRGNWWYKVRL